MPAWTRGLGLALVVASSGHLNSASAASIYVTQIDRHREIVVSGDIEPNDDDRFFQLAGPLQDDQGIIVTLSSRGGNVLAAMNMGRFIRMHAWTTVVAEHEICASACGLIWLGGVNRMMGSTALIGFHAAYRVEGTTPVESGAGNALVGAYLNSLGLSDRAIVYITRPGPSEVQLLSVPDARSLGIRVSLTHMISPSAPARRNTTAPATAPAVTPPSNSPAEDYDYAFKLLRQANYSAAAEALRAFLRNHPDDPLASNAYYWLGETYYVRKDYANAAATFAEGFQRYPTGGKAPDNLFKLGLSLSYLGQNADACRALAKLDREFPNAAPLIKDRAAQAKRRIGC